MKMNFGFGRRQILGKLILSASAAAMLSFTIAVAAVRAQYAYMPAIGAIYQAANQQLEARVNDASAALQDYYDANGHLPTCASEIDDFLISNYSKITLETLPVGSSVQGDGFFRKLPGLRMFIDPQAASLAKINNRYQYPSSWSADPNDVVITLAGDGTFVIWSADLNGKPGLFCRNGYFETRQGILSASRDSFGLAN